MMNKEAKAIVAEFVNGDSIEYISRAWLIPRKAVEGILRVALKAQDKKKGKRG